MRTLLLLSVIVAQLAGVASVNAGQDKRPFWTQKSSFIEGEDLYVVGLASNAKTVEEGRKQAFENGKLELMNFAQVTSLEARGLVIETQMTYEEPNPDGTFTVYRLLRVPAAKLISIQEQLREQTRVREIAIDKAQRDLQVMQQSVAQKQQQLEMKSRQVQDMVNSLSRLQESLGQKAMRIEQQQREVEELLKQLSAKVQMSDSSPKVRSEVAPFKEAKGAEPLAERLKEAEAKLDARELQLVELGKRARERLEKENDKGLALQNRCKHIELGMTTLEVEAVLGKPSDKREGSFLYMYMDKSGKTQFLSVGFAFNGLVNFLDGCHAKEFDPFGR